MTWSATERYRLESAPGGLGLVQDLLNTVSAGAPGSPGSPGSVGSAGSGSAGSGRADLLGDVADAQSWADEACAEWAAVTGRPAPRVILDADALPELRAFRDSLQGIAARGTGGEAADPSPVPEHTAEAVLRLGADGVVRLEPHGDGGWRRLVALFLAAVYEAQQADTTRRLKSCRNPACRVAFYDRSRNNSGVWHDVKTCGNAANLRAYRARQRER
ncbi:CGNR zinc finger domain-containing protein [Streptomyces sp. NPDC018029]|uniref:CGNR zinc finger domain-containing protein n=1 Tax=Streptomyces sp. NPDC018029 TaxID=3365032 RepID=UPI0037A13B11